MKNKAVINFIIFALVIAAAYILYVYLTAPKDSYTQTVYYNGINYPNQVVYVYSDRTETTLPDGSVIIWNGSNWTK
jgi:hypothetical protein